ncbi:MAG: hypothetical protein ACLGGV_05200 [Bacteroidia bacterium]
MKTLKRYLIIAFLSISSYSSLGQVSNAIDFLDFSFLPIKERVVYLENLNWAFLQSDRNVEKGTITEDLNYWKFYNNEKYLITLQNVLDSETGIIHYVTKVSLNNEAIFNDWIVKLSNRGYSVKQVPDNPNAWAINDEERFDLVAEKRKIKDIWVFEISVIYFTINNNRFSLKFLKTTSNVDDSSNNDDIETANTSSEYDKIELVNEKENSVVLVPMLDSLEISFPSIGYKTILKLDLESSEIEGLAVFLGDCNYKGKWCNLQVQFLDSDQCDVSSSCQELDYGLCSKQDYNVKISPTSKQKKVETKSVFVNSDDDKKADGIGISVNERKENLNRVIVFAPTVVNPTNETGNVRVQVWVDRKGRVDMAKILINDPLTTTKNKTLHHEAQMISYKYKFNESPSGYESECLYITVSFLK